MKKKITIITAVLVSCANLFSQEAKEYQSKLDKVVLFPYEAQEYRTAKIQLTAGKQELKITGLSPYIKKESVRVESDGSFAISNVNYELDYLNTTQKSKQSKALEEKIKKVKMQVEDEETEIAILNEKMAYFQANQDVKIDGKTSPLPADFKQLSEYYMSQMAAARQQLLLHQRSLKTYKDSLNAYSSQMYQLSNRQTEPSGVIAVSLNAKAAKQGTLTLSYIVQHASWTPSYDIRFQSISKPLQLSYKATVQQQTGLDWTDIPLSLSTAQTQTSADIPDLRPYYIQYFQIREKSKQIVARADNSMGETRNMVTSASTVAFNAPQTQVPAEQRTSFTFNIEGTQTVKSDNKPNQLRYKEAEIPSIYEYKSIPKLSDKVYLIGRITNWFDLGIQNGDLNLYFENAFIGTSYINTEQFNDTLDVSFGVDQGIMVKREKIKEFTSSKTLGSKKTDNIGWKITLKNNKNEAVKVKVLDQIPISKNDDFEVTVVNLSGGAHNKTTGEVEWTVSLAPRESKEIVLQYTVKYPKDMRLVTE
ncbi:MAG: DUF4139 domain-containing protein [Prevotellaceae bacterium]|jgi:uncharacterized protein (TIGR02231 family)|nr:DUF4139 domain-containing protein [Prevotellaceae bacterium]